MGHTDVAIVGGGLAGSFTAAMLGRQGIGAVLIDPRGAYPSEFRCEKLDASQAQLLHGTGLAKPVLAATTRDEEAWIVRFGRLVEKRSQDQYGIAYATLVNTVRAEIPDGASFLQDKVKTVTPGPDRQIITLANGGELSARLVVLANGLNSGLRQQLGIGCRTVSRCHSISIGFDLTPSGRQSFAFQALTCFPEGPADKMAYLTLFPIGAAMRANLFVYRELRDPWLRSLRENPVPTLLSLMPGLASLVAPFEILGDVKVRPVDLCVSEGYRKAGVVLVGDAFATSCPAAGTGVNKVLTDVTRLCRDHLPRWLGSEGMGMEKITAFYDDPVKVACDRHSAEKARFLKAISTDTRPAWRLRRWSRSAAHLVLAGARRGRQGLLTGSPPEGRSAAVASGSRLTPMSGVLKRDRDSHSLHSKQSMKGQPENV